MEDIVEETGYVLERDSEYSQKILEEEEEVSISISQKGGKTLQHQVLHRVSVLAALLISAFISPPLPTSQIVVHLLESLSNFVCACMRACSPGGDGEGFWRWLGPGSRPGPLQQQNPPGATVHEPQQDQHGPAAGPHRLPGYYIYSLLSSLTDSPHNVHTVGKPAEQITWPYSYC